MSYQSEETLITTIIPTYRRPKLLQRAIQSVLNQTYPHFQVCVYDNASGDETGRVVAELARVDSRIKYHCHSENIGSIKNFNYGMKHVETPFFSFLSDDDILFPDFYDTALASLEKYPEVSFSTTKTITVNSWGKVVNIPALNLENGFYHPPDGLLAMLKKGHPTWTGILFRSNVVDKVGLLDEEIFLCDLDYLLRTAARCSFVVSKTPGAIYVSNPSHNAEQFSFAYPSCLKIINKFKKDEYLSPDMRAHITRVINKRLKIILLKMGLWYIILKDFENAYKINEVFSSKYNLKSLSFFLSTIMFNWRYFPKANHIGKLLYEFRQYRHHKTFYDYQEKVSELFSILKENGSMGE